MKDKLMTLNQYELKAQQKNEMYFRTRSTNIACEKCDGIYRHRDSSFSYMSHPPKKSVICDKCKDQQYISC
jgi:hypothetical protein